jgi:hypothetical protein
MKNAFGASPLPLPEGAMEAKVAPGDELMSLSGPLLVGRCSGTKSTSLPGFLGLLSLADARLSKNRQLVRKHH